MASHHGGHIMANKYNNFWDSIVEVKNGALRVVEKCERPVLIWKSESEYLTRFVWLVLNDTSETGIVSKIYHTGRGIDTWEFAVVSDYEERLRNTINLLVLSLGLKMPKDIQYPQLYIINQTNYLVEPFIIKGTDLSNIKQVVVTLSKKTGFVSFLCTKDRSKVAEWDMLPYKGYMKLAKATGHNFREIISSIGSLKDGVDPDLWDSMMF